MRFVWILLAFVGFFVRPAQAQKDPEFYYQAKGYWVDLLSLGNPDDPSLTAETKASVERFVKYVKTLGTAGNTQSLHAIATLDGRTMFDTTVAFFEQKGARPFNALWTGARERVVDVDVSLPKHEIEFTVYDPDGVHLGSFKHQLETDLTDMKETIHSPKVKTPLGTFEFKIHALRFFKTIPYHYAVQVWRLANPVFGGSWKKFEGVEGLAFDRFVEEVAARDAQGSPATVSVTADLEAIVDDRVRSLGRLFENHPMVISQKEGVFTFPPSATIAIPEKYLDRRFLSANLRIKFSFGPSEVLPFISGKTWFANEAREFFLDQPKEKGKSWGVNYPLRRFDVSDKIDADFVVFRTPK